MADNLYRSCETLLKQKLLTSNLIDKNVKKTDPEVMIGEIERLCLPRVNIIVKRDQFRQLDQGKDKNINDFESRVRAKAQSCEFPRTCKASSANCLAIQKSAAPTSPRREGGRPETGTTEQTQWTRRATRPTPFDSTEWSQGATAS